jgi:hypothetical protein
MEEAWGWVKPARFARHSAGHATRVPGREFHPTSLRHDRLLALFRRRGTPCRRFQVRLERGALGGRQDLLGPGRRRHPDRRIVRRGGARFDHEILCPPWQSLACCCTHKEPKRERALSKTALVPFLPRLSTSGLYDWRKMCDREILMEPPSRSRLEPIAPHRHATPSSAEVKVVTMKCVTCHER